MCAVRRGVRTGFGVGGARTGQHSRGRNQRATTFVVFLLPGGGGGGTYTYPNPTPCPTHPEHP